LQQVSGTGAAAAKADPLLAPDTYARIEKSNNMPTFQSDYIPANFAAL
jgi:hypothetical protein